MIAALRNISKKSSSDVLCFLRIATVAVRSVPAMVCIAEERVMKHAY